MKIKCFFQTIFFIKPLNSKLGKLKSATKDKTGVTLSYDQT